MLPKKKKEEKRKNTTKRKEKKCNLKCNKCCDFRLLCSKANTRLTQGCDKQLEDVASKKRSKSIAQHSQSNGRLQCDVFFWVSDEQQQATTKASPQTPKTQSQSQHLVVHGEAGQRRQEESERAVHQTHHHGAIVC